MEPLVSVLKETPSGNIESVFDGVTLRILYNASCRDVNDVCRAACCRYRSGYSITLEPEEIGRYESRPFPGKPEVEILRSKEDGLSCIYLDDEKALCTIYERRPKMCRSWHCSPDGSKGDPEITERDAGWMLLPMRREEAMYIAQSQKEKEKKVNDYFGNSDGSGSDPGIAPA